MSIWGKLIGGAAGFALGGPLGALIGAGAGHLYDALKATGEREAQRLAEAQGDMWQAARQDPRQIAFATGVIVLSAKMAKADGQVTREEIDTFKRLFNVGPQDGAAVGAVFDEARREPGGFEPYARQIAEMFATEPALLEELLDALYRIAMADGVLHPAEADYLKRVAEIFGFAEPAYERIHRGNVDPQHADPYAQLGTHRDASEAELKAAYRRLLRENHPDTLIAKGMPEEFVKLATDKMARINAAWDRIRAERGIR